MIESGNSSEREIQFMKEQALAESGRAIKKLKAIYFSILYKASKCSGSKKCIDITTFYLQNTPLKQLILIIIIYFWK